VGRAGRGRGSRGLYFFYLSLGVRWGLPPFSSRSLSKPFTPLPVPCAGRNGICPISPHSFTSPGESYCELEAGVLGSSCSSVTDSLCDIWQSPSLPSLGLRPFICKISIIISTLRDCCEKCLLSSSTGPGNCRCSITVSSFPFQKVRWQVNHSPSRVALSHVMTSTSHMWLSSTLNVASLD